MTKTAILLAALLLTACDRGTPSGDPEADSKLEAGQVALIARAPDGTVLWAVGSGGRIVYFATSGTQTQHTENCGKHCRRTVIDAVPTSEGGPQP